MLISHEMFWVRRGFPTRADRAGLGVVSIAGWPRRRWLVAMTTTAFAGLLIGVPQEPLARLLTRMTPVTWWDHRVWAVSAGLIGLIVVSGALIYWAPIEPLLGALSLGLLSVGLAVRFVARLSQRRAAAEHRLA